MTKVGAPPVTVTYEAAPATTKQMVLERIDFRLSVIGLAFSDGPGTFILIPWSRIFSVSSTESVNDLFDGTTDGK
jgi:hypothetical protein